MAASCNSVYGRHREVFGYINDTGSGTSITIFSFFTSIARLEKGKLGRPSLRTYKVLSFIVITQGRGGLYLLASMYQNQLFYFVQQCPYSHAMVTKEFTYNIENLEVVFHSIDFVLTDGNETGRMLAAITKWLSHGKYTIVLL